MADGGDLVMLTENAQLKNLALLLRNKEEKLVTQVMKSENERVKYLKSVSDAYDHAMSLLDDSTAMKDSYPDEGGADDATKANIAQNILEYIKYGLNMSMQNIRNCCLRVDCIGKIRAHYDSLISNLANLNPEDQTNVRRLAEETAKFKKCMFEHCNKYRSGSARALSKAYSIVLKQEGIKFEDLVNRHKNKLQFEGEFNNLTDAEKFEVYNSIMEESGRGTVPAMEMPSTEPGAGMLVVAAAMIVWDIFTGGHKFKAVLRKSLNALSEVGAFAVQVQVEGAVEGAEAEAVADVEAGVFIVSLPWFVVAALEGLLLVADSRLLVELLVTGGNTAPPVSDLKFHTAAMPDGMALAYTIHQDG